jgi:DNA-binding NtrC family response regulator
VICSPQDSSNRRDAIRLGAQEVLVRPFDEDRLESAVYRHLAAPSDEEPEVDSEDIEQIGPDSFFLSASPVTQQLRAQAESLAEADVPALILGERGSGKDTVARLIHKLSVRSGFPFLKVNCGEMPEDLLEAELLGTGRASPFGNTRSSLGKIERADKGTIFLEEITEMPISLQGRMMQLLQDKTVAKAAGDRPVPVDVRILAATSTNVDRALAAKRFREDLYYRLSAFTVQVPPLRQRKVEIAILLQHSMHKLARHYGLPAREFPSAVLSASQRYSWPGNVKELESFVKRYLVAGDTQLDFSGLDSDSRAKGHDHAIYGARASAGSSAFERDPPCTKSLKSLIQDVKWEAEKNAIGTALQKTGWNRKAAARLLQVSYRTLLYKIDQYHMNAPEPFLAPVPAAKLSFTPTDGRKEE